MLTMPLEVVAISYVQGETTRDLGTTRFVIGSPMKSFYTFDPLIASLCERAHACGFPVLIGSVETMYGWRIVSADRENGAR